MGFSPAGSCVRMDRTGIGVASRVASCLVSFLLGAASSLCGASGTFAFHGLPLALKNIKMYIL